MCSLLFHQIGRMVDLPEPESPVNHSTAGFLVLERHSRASRVNGSMFLPVHICLPGPQAHDRSCRAPTPPPPWRFVSFRSHVG